MTAMTAGLWLIGAPISLFANGAPATFQVAPVDNWVQSSSPWTPGATISLTIEDGGGVVYADSQTADGGGNFNFNLGGAFDLQRGHVVSVSDGTNTKTHTVTNLHVDGADVAGDLVFGRADAGTSVDVWVHGNGGLVVAADGAGEWVADFSSMTDITYLSDGSSSQADGDGDSTWVWWAGPRFWAAPADNWVQSSSPWTPGSTISLTIEDGGGVVYADSQTADADGNFNFNLWGAIDLQRGHVVTVSDGTNTKTHTVANLFVDSVDASGDRILGRADVGTSVDVWVHDNGWLRVTADGAGEWIADFSTMTDLTYLSDGASSQTDGDGDSTGVWWSGPRFTVAPVDDWVSSWSTWTPGASVSLTIEDGSGVVHADWQTADAGGYFNFNLRGVFDVQRGHVVTVSDGMNTKTHTVASLFVDRVDVLGDRVLGRADAGTSVDVWVHGDGQVTATADGGGEWVADFSGMTDLTRFSDGASSQTDSDGDSTGVWWASPPVIAVEIDIKPGSDPNCINPNGHGVIPVAILGSVDFDVTQIDVGTLVFAGLDVRVRGNGAPQCSLNDVSGDFTDAEGAPDGHDDLVCQFLDDAGSWTPGDGTATLTGSLVDGTAIEGTDSICVVL